jgi:hypothetical protein
MNKLILQEEINIYSLWQLTGIIRNSYENKKGKQIFCSLIYNAASIRESSIVG